MGDNAAADATPIELTKEEKQKKWREAKLLELEIKASLASFSSILPPVFLTMILSAAIVLYVTPDIADDIPNSPIVAFNEDDAEDNGEAAGIGILNALILIGGITVMTFVIVLLIYFKCEKIFAAYLVFALVMLMGYTTAFMVLEGLDTYSIATDFITFVIFFYNYAIVGAIAIFSFEGGLQGPTRLIPYGLTQVYLVLVSVVMAWLVTTLFPEFTVWGLLIFLAFYDLCAVLTPCGPLNCLLKVVAKRQEEEEAAAIRRGDNPEEAQERQMIPGLLYEVNTGKSTGLKRFKKNNDAGAAGPLNLSIIFGVTSEGDPKEEPLLTEEDREEPVVEENQETTEHTVTDYAQDADIPPKDIAKEREEKEAKRAARQAQREAEILEDMKQHSNLKLGLGDFVFYSVLTAKAAEFGFVAFASVAVCILCGLCGTLILLSVFQKALPALPISIFLGVFTYLIVFILVSPFADGMVASLVAV